MTKVAPFSDEEGVLVPESSAPVEESKTAEGDHANLAAFIESVGLANSSHGWMLKHGASPTERLLGFGLVVIQISMYMFLFTLGIKDVKENKVPLQIKYSDCRALSGSRKWPFENATTRRQMSFDKLQCESLEPGTFSAVFVQIMSASIVLMYFLPDLASAARLVQVKSTLVGSAAKFRCMLAGILLFLQMFVGMLVVGQGISLSMLESFPAVLADCVAVIFISDVDEKIYEYYARLSSKGQASKHWPLKYLVLVVVIGTVFAASMAVLQIDFLVGSAVFDDENETPASIGNR
mmetsp:Transcript_3583/g.6787  ORF Transcript_3583/g.6787 Transcript_3583/m.6787 type:complete len:293 (+) Transcript_3583:27-905(+)|eukprot:CAMPEP_0175162572 /NCGR_PEP_ID=MMETSP0087-20121206/25228_1 /TAXON_ID=136419 /ORGANISM="Unknown Unknown, Strain D1" /LENGTH=292 /DNA_ID=CAMNT_0016451099 /DNA_START=55 /DNA_END=933 /DNA_ORIENTATION=+